MVLRRFVGCSRFVWNELLALNELRSLCGERRLGYSAMCDYLTYLKDEYPFLREVHSQPLQQTLKDLERAYGRAFDPSIRAGMPRFKKCGRPIGIRFPQGFKIDGGGVCVPKIGWIGFRKSRAIEGSPKNVSVSFEGRDWYVTIQTEREMPDMACSVSAEVGIDLGVTRFAALSDGTFVDGASALGTYERR
ncbi:MAG: RNA-guided endonuclease InsQ/TnpB family protein, partial [Vulcanimicrobiaceae bacterium]